jgi:hypothetical protein
MHPATNIKYILIRINSIVEFYIRFNLSLKLSLFKAWLEMGGVRKVGRFGQVQHFYNPNLSSIFLNSHI